MVRILDEVCSFDRFEVLRDVDAVCREWREFRNGARTDGLRLSHWAKTGTDPDAGRQNPRDPVFWSLTPTPRISLRTV